MGADEKVRFFAFPAFSYERDPQQFFDDTCVVPERLEGKTEYINSEFNQLNSVILSETLINVLIPVVGVWYYHQYTTENNPSW